MSTLAAEQPAAMAAASLRPRGETFTEDEVVLAYHGPLLYEAQIKEIVVKKVPDCGTSVSLYLLQYQGWSEHWNEWVPESRLLKKDEDSERRQKERVKEFHRAHKRDKRLRETAAAAPSKKAKPGAVSASTAADLETEIREALRLPQALKLRLIEEWEHISREKTLVPLPREPNINTLLDDFIQAKAKKSTHERLYVEVCDGLRSYFNQALGSILLYKFERRQFQDARQLHKAEPLTNLYGAEHLLRLFVKLPELLSRARMQPEHLTVLLAKLAELLKFMQTSKSKYFATDYQHPGKEYLEWWEKE